MKQKISLKAKQSNLKILYFLSFLLAITVAMPAYIESSYLSQFVNITGVSLFFLLSNFLAIIAVIYFPRIIKRFKNYRASEAVLFLFFASLIAMSLVRSGLGAFIAFSILAVCIILFWINMDIFVESFTSTIKTGRVRTIYLTCSNLGWIIAPMISSYFIDLSGFRIVYLASAISLAIFYIIFIKKNRRLVDRNKYRDLKILETCKKIWRSQNLRGIFMVAILLNTFYSLAVIYMPLHLTQNMGFSWGTLGIAFSIMLIPLILFEIPAGIMADKYWGEKEMLYVGLSIIILALLLFYGLDSKDIMIWGALLFFSRIGTALVEAMRETYFFKIVDAEDLSIIDFYRSSIPLGYILGTIIGVLVTSFLPINYTFLILAIIMTSGFYYIRMIKDTK